MRERTFRKPSARELLQMQGIDIPNRIGGDFILQLIDSKILVPVVGSYEQAVETVENLEEGCFALFDRRFRVSREESDYGIKSLDDLVKIDSQRNLRIFSTAGIGVPNRLTREFAEECEILPYKLIEASMGSSRGLIRADARFDIEHPPIGFYWVGTDNHARGTTWTKAIAGAEMQVMKQAGDFSGGVLDSKPYGRNLRVRVNSRTEEGKEYEFTLLRLPMHGRDDPRQFSDWINIAHNSGDPDASYRGGAHERRVHPVCFWSASTIFSFYDAMVFVGQHPEWNQFRINPFPIPTDEKMIDFVDDLRLRSLLLDERDERPCLSVLGKKEIDRMIGARTILRKYDNCWHHMGKKDLSYLYQPR